MSITTMIPAFINPQAGTATQALEILLHDKRFSVQECAPRHMAQAVRDCVKDGTKRILACGGDGTLALIAGQIAGSSTELAIYPGGTLNHFAARIALPENPEQLLDLAAHGTSAPIDAGYVNGHLFLNTSSVGAYVHFVRTRNYLEKRMNYSFASMFAGFRRFLRMRSARISLDENTLRTPLVFIGVGERELSFPFLGKDKKDGQRGLHLIAVKSHGRLDTIGIAFNALLRGIDPLAHNRQVENRILKTINLSYARRKKKRIHVALDGEIHALRAPLSYRYQPHALHVVRGQRL